VASTVRTFATACQVARPPCTDPTSFPAVGDFYFQASNGSVALPVAGYDYNSDWTPLLVRLSLTGMAVSLAAPDLLTQRIARMSGRGTERKADTFGFAPVALKIIAVSRCLRCADKKTGQVLVRASPREKVSHFNGKDRLCQEL
jgi:hypothetical protein